MMNMQGLMKQAQMMQKRLEESQARLEQEEFEGQSGGGLVKVTLTGKFAMRKISIGKAALEDAEMLEDLIMAAYNDAKNKVEKRIADSMQGMNIPGLKF